jgi:ribonuclease HII
MTKAQDTLFPDLFAGDQWQFERRAHALGARMIAGIDEAGRGPLAGPVVAAAVVLPIGCSLPGVDDSKKVPESKREILFDLIHREAIAVGVGISEAVVVDRINILQATLTAMRQAVEQLVVGADYLLVDGISRVPLDLPQQTLTKGESRSISIAAASIIAKVTRDRLMVQLDREFPGYGLADHKGYGTREHLAAIARLGPTTIHRLTFRGVREHLAVGEVQR